VVRLCGDGSCNIIASRSGRIFRWARKHGYRRTLTASWWPSSTMMSFPTQSWLLTLFKAARETTRPMGVLGPVKPHFEIEPPQWVIEGRFYDRARYPTGLVIKWKMGRTGNVLLRRRILTGEAQLFRPEFSDRRGSGFFSGE